MSDAAGKAALTICESLLISLREQGVVSEDEVWGLLSDASESHRQMGREATEAEARAMHSAVATLIERVRNRNNSVHPLSKSKDGAEVDEDEEASGDDA